MLTMMHVSGSDYSDRRLRFRQRAFRSGTLQPNRSRPIGGVAGRRSGLLPFPPRQGQADSLAATDFICSERDQSTAQMRADSTSESCCCRVRCGADAGCSAGQHACSNMRPCAARCLPAPLALLPVLCCAARALSACAALRCSLTEWFDPGRSASLLQRAAMQLRPAVGSMGDSEACAPVVAWGRRRGGLPGDRAHLCRILAIAPGCVAEGLGHASLRRVHQRTAAACQPDPRDGLRHWLPLG